MWEEGSHRPKLQGWFKKLMQQRPLDAWVPVLTGPVLPPRQRPLSPAETVTLANQVATWLAKGVIEMRRTPSPINNNIVFAAKANGGIRVCDDCTPVNAVTKDYDWPLPRLQDLRHRTRGSTWFSRIDLKDAFFRIRVPSEYRHYTAFTCQGRQYQFKRMPFGVKTGPSTFQQFMETRLAALLLWLFVYIDDLLIHASTLQELRRRTQRVKRALQDAGCEINETKSEYEKRTLLFAGLRLTTDGVAPNRAQVDKVLKVPCPRTKAEMQSALGLTSYLRDYILLVSHFTSELYPDKNGAKLPPNEYAERWASLMRHIASAVSSLRHWSDTRDADLYADASGTAVGVVLIQDGKIVALSARKLQPAETRYSATDREHLALVWAAKKMKIFLHRDQGVTRVWSDHAALVGKRSADMTPRQERWQTIVNQWMPHVKHVPGKDNPADFISRWGLEIEGGVEKL